MDEWDKLDQQFTGNAPAAPKGDAWDELDASMTRQAAQPEPAAAKPVAMAVQQLPQKGEKQTRMDRYVRGLRDPIDGGAQLLYNSLPTGLVKSVDAANNWLADKTGLVARVPEGGIDQSVRESEAAYQAARRDAMPATMESQITGKKADPGFDGYRLLGNLLNPTNLAVGARAPQAASMLGRMGVGAAMGAGNAALTPVGEGDYWDEKKKQIATGAIAGGTLPVLTGAASRVIAPNAIKNTELQLLKAEGVRPTIGQALGGRWNTLEEKMTSLPIVGDAISMARQRAANDFNKAAINRATGEVGQKVSSIGQKGVAEAGDKISAAYDDALNSLGPVRFDNQFAQDAAQLQAMASNLVPDMQRKFEKTYRDIVVGRMSPNGSMMPETFKKVDSELGHLAATYGKSTVASEKEAGAAIKQLGTILREQAARNDPASAAKLRAADAGYAGLVRVEGAAKQAMNNEGVFTPGQLNMAIRTADQSTRKRAVSRGEALMQDLGNAGQKVLGNKVPNSFTTDRALISAGALGSGAIAPAVPAALLGGAALYTSPLQRALVGAASSRPQGAQAVADALRKRSMLALPAATQSGLYFLDN